MIAFLIKLALGGFNIVKVVGRFVSGFLRKLDGRGWCELGAGLAAFVLMIHFAGEAGHWKKQDARDVKALAIEQAKAARIAQKAVDLKNRIDALSSSIATKAREEHDAKVAHIAADAAAIGLRGPGRATCPGDSSLSARASGHSEVTAAGAPSGPEVPASDRAAVPWPWLVKVIEEHDELLAEAEAWRANDKQQRAAWPRPEGAK